MAEVDKNRLGKTVSDYRCSCGYLHAWLFVAGLALKRCRRCGRRYNWK